MLFRSTAPMSTSTRTRNGTCSDPTIIYGRLGAQQQSSTTVPSFSSYKWNNFSSSTSPNDFYTTSNQIDFPFGRTIDIASPADLICSRLQNPCNASQRLLNNCYAAKAAAIQLAGQEAADTFNRIILQAELSIAGQNGASTAATDAGVIATATNNGGAAPLGETTASVMATNAEGATNNGGAAITTETTTPDRKSVV